jgi:hypothetical protein
MKRWLLILTVGLISGQLHAQDTVKRSDFSSPNFSEDFYVLKKDKKVRQGAYQAAFEGTVIARGRYDQNNRTGIWSFANRKGEIVQTFDYERHIIAIDSADNRTFQPSYSYADTLNNTVHQAPIKIGGSFLGYYPLLFSLRVNLLLHHDFPDLVPIRCQHVFFIDKAGKLVRHDMTAVYRDQTKQYHLNDDFLDDDARRFLPAKSGGQPVECQISINTTITQGVHR